MKYKLIFYDHEGLVDEVYDITCTKVLDDVPDDSEDEWSDVWPNQNIGMDEWQTIVVLFFEKYGQQGRRIHLMTPNSLSWILESVC